MGISFLGALGHGGSGFIDGMNEYEKRQQQQMENEQRGRDLDSQTAYGNALAGTQGSWAQQPNSIWQRLAGLFGQAQEEQRNPMGATALPEGVQPVQPEQNSFDRIGNMLRQEMGGGPAPMPQTMPQGAPQGPMGAQPMPQAQPQGAPQMGGLMPGRMSLPDIAQRVAAANPGAPPHVIAGAIDRFRPWMSDEAKIQWQQAQLTLREAQLQQRENNAQQRFTQNERRIDQGDERLAQQGETSRRRLEQGDRRLGIQEEQGNRRLGIQEEQGNRRLEQGDRRLGQGDRRLGIQEEQGNRRLTTGETNAETRRRQQEDTSNYRTQRLGQIERQIEQRGQQMAAVEQRFQQRMANARDEKDRAAAIREYEQAWKQYSEATGRIIQAQSATMSSQERNQLLSGVTKQREEAMRKLEQFRGQPSNVYSPRVGNTSMQPPAAEQSDPELAGKLERSQAVQGARRQEQGGKSTMRAEPQQPPAQAGPPPEIMETLKTLPPGKAIRTPDGTRWMNQDGRPVKVEERSGIQNFSPEADLPAQGAQQAQLKTKEEEYRDLLPPWSEARVTGRLMDETGFMGSHWSSMTPEKFKEYMLTRNGTSNGAEAQSSGVTMTEPLYRKFRGAIESMGEHEVIPGKENGRTIYHVRRRPRVW